MTKNYIKIICALTLFGASISANAGLVTAWTISGPGSTSSTQSAYNSWALNYDTVNSGAWVASAVVTEAGDYTFDWDYSGFHAFFAVRAFLSTSDGTSLVNVGPENCCTAPSAGFTYNGTYTFENTAVNDIISFSFGGRNGDSNPTISGSLNITQVSAPSAFIFVGFGLAALFINRKKFSKT